MVRSLAVCSSRQFSNLRFFAALSMTKEEPVGQTGSLDTTVKATDTPFPSRNTFYRFCG
jgi:hypothetical protein